MKMKIIIFGLIFLLCLSTSQISAIKLSSNMLAENCKQYSDNSLLLSTYLGGDDKDGMYYTGVNLERDNQGNVFITGTTESLDFPTTSNAYSQVNNGDSDIFITKMNNDFTDVLASTYIGGSDKEEARGIVVDSNGNIFVCGATESSDFPVTMNAFQSQYRGGTEMPYGSGDGFIVKLNNDLEMVSSTFLGGSGHDFCNSICINSVGNIIVTGSTSSSNFPVSEDAYDSNHDNGGYFKDDVFITKLNNDLSDLIASTFIGGSNDDYSESISVDSSNYIFIGGWTGSSNFPTTLNAYDSSFGGGYYDGFISKLNDDLTDLISSTYTGGNQWDFCYTLNLDKDDNVYVSGHTASLNYPTSSTAYCRNYQGAGGPNIGDDAFISKFSNNLSIIHASTYLGGDNWENGFSLIISDNGMVYLAGTTTSSDFPAINSFCDIYKGGIKPNGDIFISCFFNDLSNLYASTFLGGSSDDGPGELIFDINGEIIVSGSTSSSDFPIFGNCYDTTYNGDADVFLSKFKQGITDNHPPNKPNIDGPKSGKPENEYTYITWTIDPDGDNVFYLFDWGDGHTSFKYGPYNSGEECSASNIWFDQGEYEVKVKAVDINNAESEWSDPLIVSMPKYKFFKTLIFDNYYELLKSLKFFKFLK
jgi:hypothetical protein